MTVAYVLALAASAVAVLAVAGWVLLPPDPGRAYLADWSARLHDWSARLQRRTASACLQRRTAMGGAVYCDRPECQSCRMPQ